MDVRVLTSSEAAEVDRHSIECGIPSRTLMQRAGKAAAVEIVRRYPEELKRGVAVIAGPGNNGGDAWVVARELAAAGLSVRAHEVEPPRTKDARAERSLAGRMEAPRGDEGIVVDGVLGIGAKGAPRGAVADAVSRIKRARANGARVVALDVPSGLDADTGDGDAVVADLTLTFGAFKRGLLANRDTTGAIVALDIGFTPDSLEAKGLGFADEDWVLSRVPGFAADAHKGDRRRIALIGGNAGMAGAIILAGRAALRAGAGLVMIATVDANVAAVHAAVPEALVKTWREFDPSDDWADAIAIGPGLGVSDETHALVDRIASRASVPVVLDADALNAFAGRREALCALCTDRPIVLTPHPAEMARLTGTSVDEVLRRRWEIGGELAIDLSACVLLKGVPTVVSALDERVMVVARGTPALATGGSGDVLTGTIATLLAQIADPFEAAVCGAWAHGRAAELANEGRTPRGVVLGDILEALGHVWNGSPSPSHPILAELPAMPT